MCIQLTHEQGCISPTYTETGDYSIRLSREDPAQIQKSETTCDHQVKRGTGFCRVIGRQLYVTGELRGATKTNASTTGSLLCIRIKHVYNKQNNIMFTRILWG